MNRCEGSIQSIDSPRSGEGTGHCRINCFRLATVASFAPCKVTALAWIMSHTRHHPRVQNSRVLHLRRRCLSGLASGSSFIAKVCKPSRPISPHGRSSRQVGPFRQILCGHASSGPACGILVWNQVVNLRERDRHRHRHRDGETCRSRKGRRVKQITHTDFINS